MKPAKPPYGSPECNGCGQCCLDNPCPLGAMVFEQIDGACPALEDAGDRYVCGLVEHPRKYAPVRAAVSGADKLSKAATFCIGVGVGCDAQTDGEPDNPANKLNMRRDAAGVHERKIAIALMLWLGALAPYKVQAYQMAISR